MKIDELTTIEEDIGDWINRIADFFTGKKDMLVYSSWIHRLKYADGKAIMSLLNGRQYVIDAVDKKLYKDWVDSASKGKFFHDNIKRNHNISPF